MTITEPRFNQGSEMRDIDDDVANAGIPQAHQMTFDECGAADFKQGFGQRIGQGREALAASSGKYHGFHGVLPLSPADAIIECAGHLTDVVSAGDLALFAAY